MQAKTIPVTVFTGFLGSGKTTIISHLIELQQAENQQIVYIKNEIGAENIDAKIMQGKHITSRELLNGCICCTLVGPFLSAISEIISEFHPDRIIIEASGAADPAAIALMIDGNPLLKRDGVIAIIDVVNFTGYKDLSVTARNQTKFTDLIVFNKVEEISLEQKMRVVGYVRELNSSSPIIEAPGGKLDPALVFGIETTDLTALLTEPHDHTHHLSQDGLESIALHFSGAVAEEKLLTWIANLPNAVFRIKGIVHILGKGSQLLNTVGTRTTLAPYFDEKMIEKNSLVLIGFHLAENGLNVTDLLDSVQSTLVSEN